MSEELPVLKLLRKPSDQIQVNLSKVQGQLKSILEQTRSATAFPVALLDSQRLETIILSTTEAYGQALKETLQTFEQTRSLDTEKLAQLTGTLEQTSGQFTQILSLLSDIAGLIKKQTGNAELERQVLQKLDRALGEQ